MKLTRDQLKTLINEELAKSNRVKFEDVSPLAHDAGLYEAVGKLHNVLATLLDHDEAEKWLRELVQDAVDSQVEDFAQGH